MDEEHQAYQALVADGGRPSHPLHLIHEIVLSPGKYRDILNSWQSHPDEWRVFTKQWKRWQSFRDSQRQRRMLNENRDPRAYTSKIKSYLWERHAFETPASFRSPSGLRLDPKDQDKLTTWIEYLYHECRVLDEREKKMDQHKARYLEARDALSQSGISVPYGQRQEADLCNPSSIVIARQMFEERKLREEARQREKRETATKALKALETKDMQISQFQQKTRQYRLARSKAERHRVLVQWAYDQIPLIEAEQLPLPSIEANIPLTSIETGSQDGRDWRTKPLVFPRFSQLPAELRQKVWIDCLPPHPTAHFFDVLNHPRMPHLAHFWSKEFRVRATRSRESGYRTVYALLRTCRDARLTVAAFYRRVYQTQSPDVIVPTSAWESPCPIFQTFDWLPAEDLVVLCLPPKETSLPDRHAITFARGPPRHVGIHLPREIVMMAQFGLRGHDYSDRNRDREDEADPFVDDESQVPLIPEFLDLLRRPPRAIATSPNSEPSPDRCTAVGGEGGIKKVYLIFEGLRDADMEARRTDTPKDAHVALWTFDGARRDETSWTWDRTFYKPPPPGDRVYWWVGSGRRRALAGGREVDLIERTPGRCAESLLASVSDGCESYGWSGFEGVDVLGGMERE